MRPCGLMMKVLIIAVLTLSAFGAPSERSVQRLPACRAGSVSEPERWKAIEPPHGQVRFRIPPDMQEVRDLKMACVHGCEEWARGTFRVLVVRGMWGSGSFDDKSWASACTEKHGALRIVLMRSQEGDKHVVVVWPVNESSTQSTEDVLLNVQWSDPADDRNAAKVIASVR